VSGLEELAQSPILFTDAAVAMLREYATTLADAEGKLLRVAIRGGGCSGFIYVLDYDEPRSIEERHEHNGIAYLLDSVSERYLRGTTIDYVSSLSGTGFAFRNPNAKGTCGCGQSYTA